MVKRKNVNRDILLVAIGTAGSRREGGLNGA